MFYFLCKYAVQHLTSVNWLWEHIESDMQIIIKPSFHGFIGTRLLIIKWPKRTYCHEFLHFFSPSDDFEEQSLFCFATEAALSCDT